VIGPVEAVIEERAVLAPPCKGGGDDDRCEEQPAPGNADGSGMWDLEARAAWCGSFGFALLSTMLNGVLSRESLRHEPEPCLPSKGTALACAD
jgi:hypothetical protein